jgi:putative endonuclease
MSALSRKELGQWGENFVSGYLVQRGYKLLRQNARTPYGEIDLIARKGGVTVFVEVKTRSSKAFGYPEEAITDQKRVHLIEASQAFLQENPELDGDWRIDVIAVLRLGNNKEPQIEHFENAVS